MFGGVERRERGGIINIEELGGEMRTNYKVNFISCLKKTKYDKLCIIHVIIFLNLKPIFALIMHLHNHLVQDLF